MDQKSRRASSLLLAGWFGCLALGAVFVYLFGPKPPRIALLSVSDGMTMTYGSIYLVAACLAALATLVVVQWAIGGLQSLFEIHPAGPGESKLAASFPLRICLLGAYALIPLLMCYLVFVRLGKTLLCTMPQDSFIFFDGALRLAHGQVQHVNFHTPMGLFCNVLPYLGMKITGEFAGSVEWGSLIAAVLLLAAAVLIFASRLSFAASIPTLLYFCLLAVVPLGIEANSAAVTHAMFFNRLGWVGISVIFVLFLSPRLPSKYTLLADSISLASLLLFLFYLKLTYFMVAFAFLPCLCFLSSYNRRLSLIAFLLVAAGVGAVELVYHIHAPYFRDVWMAIQASGVNRGAMAQKLMLNLKDYALFAVAVALTWDRSQKGSWFYLAFIAFVAAGGLAIIDQNTHSNGIVCLLSALLVSHEVLRRSIESAAASAADVRVRVVKCLACLGLVLILVIQPIVDRSASIAMIRSAVIQVDPNMQGGLRDMVFADQLWKHFCSGLLRDPNTNKIIPTVRPSGPAGTSYLESLLDGVQVLEAAGTSGKHVIVFDFVSPFSSILGLEPARDGHTAIDYNRTMGDRDFTPPEVLLGPIDYVMIPRMPVIKATTDFLIRTYGKYLESNFKPTSETAFWTLWSRQPPDDKSRGDGL